MSLSPGYGEAPIPGDELQALLPHARELLGEPVTKSAVYDLRRTPRLFGSTPSRTGTAARRAFSPTPVFAAAQRPETLEVGDALFQYDWDLDKARYIQLLREYDRHRDPRELAAFVPVVSLGT